MVASRTPDLIEAARCFEDNGYLAALLGGDAMEAGPVRPRIMVTSGSTTKRVPGRYRPDGAASNGWHPIAKLHRVLCDVGRRNAASERSFSRVVKCLTPDLLVRHLNEGLCRFKLGLAFDRHFEIPRAAMPELHGRRRAVRIVKPSMSPKGVEHAVKILDRLGLAR